MTRNEVRYAYSEVGLSVEPITFERMCALRDAINSEMLKAGLMDGTFHMKHPSKIRVHSEKVAELRCQSHYFDDREAVTFNEDGFVGFAGWADDENIQPILAGFLQWVSDEAAAARAA